MTSRRASGDDKNERSPRDLLEGRPEINISLILTSVCYDARL